MTAANNAQGGESREELLRVTDLWSFLCELVLQDAIRLNRRRESNGPSFLGAMATAFLSVFFICLRLPVFFYVFAAMTFAQLLWLLLAKAGNARNSPQKIQAAVQEGKFPAELRDSVIKRLRWWNYLIVPLEWTPNSRVFDIQKNLDKRREDIVNEIKYWHTDEGRRKLAEKAEKEKAAQERKEEQERKLRYLQSTGMQMTAQDENKGKPAAPAERFNDPAMLTRRIISVEQRDYHISRILAIPDCVERLEQEKVFVEAMLMKIQKIAEMMENISALHPHLESISATSMENGAREVVAILEQRRQLVSAINRVHPQDVLRLVGYDVNFVKNLNEAGG